MVLKAILLADPIKPGERGRLVATDTILVLHVDWCFDRKLQPYSDDAK
jgi:hypothetical protein